MSIVDIVLRNIKQLRIGNRYSLEEVAQGIGYETAKGYYDLESGKTSVKLEHLERLSKFYKVSIDFFLKQDSTEKVQGDNDNLSDQPAKLPRTG